MSTRRSQADSSGPRFQMTQTKPPAEPRKAPRVAHAMRARCHEQNAKAKSLPGTMVIHSHQITTSSKQKRPSRRQGEGAMEPCERVANACAADVCACSGRVRDLAFEHGAASSTSSSLGPRTSPQDAMRPPRRSERPPTAAASQADPLGQVPMGAWGGPLKAHPTPCQTPMKMSSALARGLVLSASGSRKVM